MLFVLCCWLRLCVVGGAAFALLAAGVLFVDVVVVAVVGQVLWLIVAAAVV